MNNICNNYVEDLLARGLKKFGGVCPECLHQVSKHGRKPLCVDERKMAADKSWCTGYRVGECGKDPCEDLHQDCKYKDGCKNRSCKFGHSSSWNSKVDTPMRVDKSWCVGYRVGECRKDPCEDLHQDCKYNDGCKNRSCKFGHSSSWNSKFEVETTSVDESDGDDESTTTSDLGSDVSDLNFNVERRGFCRVDCIDFHCGKKHPKHRTRLCFYGVKCHNIRCQFLHPTDRSFCEQAQSCRDFFCAKIHPLNRKSTCEFSHGCLNIKCTSLHPPTRPAVCPLKSECRRFACVLLHAANRPNCCRYGESCSKQACSFLHPDEDCPQSSRCSDKNCKFRHPRMCEYGIKCKNEGCELVHPDGWDPLNDFPGVQLKTFETRDQERRTTRQLPIFKCYSEIIGRLAQHKILIVTADTGSGKTTQLPQYAAEKFDGLVVCTQPRGLAATALATRISDEYDGESVGYNVGYKVGGGRSKNGKRIMLMTDAALVRMAQDDDLLTRVSVLIIDEAHERSLNTDLVLGIAKRIRQRRSRDFHVIIASATINPKPFLDFFFGIISTEAGRQLHVEGRMFPISLPPPVIPKDKYVNVVQELLIPTLVKSLKTYEEGHCLVFLPGSGEVDKAITSFRNCSGYQDSWEPLPLYGGLSPEDQAKIFEFPTDGLNGSNRMIVFCTNIAETSLTVPNVKLVVDTGLAKEARFDAQRRMTVLEEVYVSKSSADQRKGRAGRTSPGVCVRLYDFDNLPRQNIEPELLRSSLDLVSLQLCVLGGDFHPDRFYFLDRPPEQSIQASLALLRSLGCLGVNDAVTDKGKIFNDLPFDPRLSSFVMMMHERYDKLELGAQIAALLTAPGSVYFMGGADKSAKQLKQERIATSSRGFDSDILHLHSTFLKWKVAGDNIVDGKCMNLDCNRKASQYLGCSRCRSSVANIEGLNNKICGIVDKTADDVMKVIISKDPKRQSSSSGRAMVNDVEAIGRSLVGNFREQIGEMLMPSSPDCGIYLISSRLKGLFSAQSCVANNVAAGTKFLIAMSLMQIPSGKLIVSNCHQLQPDWIPEDMKNEMNDIALDMVECYRRKNIHRRYQQVLQRYFDESIAKQKNGESNAVVVASSNRVLSEELVLISFDNIENTLRIHAPRGDSNRIAAIAHLLVEDQIRSDVEYESNVIVSGGNVNVTVTGGCNIEAVEQSGIQLKVRLNRLPLGEGIKSEETFMKWLLSEVKISRSDVKWQNFRPCKDDEDAPPQSSGSAIVVFKNTDAAGKVLSLSGRLEGTVSQEFSAEEEWGRKVQIVWPGNITYSNLKQMYDLPASAKESILTKKPEVYTVMIKFVPENVNKEYILSMLAYRPPKDIQMQPRNGLQNIYLNFSDSQSMTTAFMIIKASHLCQPGMISKRGAEVTCKSNSDSQLTKIDVTLKSMEDALKVCEVLSRENSNSCKGIAKVEIGRAHLHHELGVILDDIKVKFDVTVDISKTKKDENKQFLTFLSSDPVKCGQAAQKLSSQTKPLVIKLYDRKQQVMLYELYDSKKLVEMAEQYGLEVEATKFHSKKKDAPQEKLIYCLTIWGPAVSQGQFMADIGDYSDSFKSRYYQVQLGNEYMQFKKGKMGASRIATIDQEIGSNGQVTIIHNIQAIEVFLSVDAENPTVLMHRLKGDIENLLSELGVSRRDMTAADRMNSCVYCREESTHTLSICGHKTCKPCFSRTAEQSKTFPMRCPVKDCQMQICIKDFETLLDKNIFEKVCCNSVMNFLKESKHHPLGCCPIAGCTGILSKQDGYSVCYVCNNSVCCVCGAQNDTLHTDKNCRAYRRLKISSRSFDYKKLFEDAKTFVNNNWSAELDPINKIDENVGLRRGCPSMQRYCKAIMEMGGISVCMNSAFFAWHGTKSVEGVVGICHDGFNPSYRSGQLHGPGEYFGISSAVSNGYAGNSGMMIVAQLLRAPCTSTQSNFCYIVNNPIDWKIAYNLPVLVLQYGQGKSGAVVPFQNCPEQPLPFVPPEEEEKWELENDSASRKSESIYRWHWQGDKQEFNPYTDEINSLIESEYNRLRNLPQQSQSFVTPEITRYVDDKPQRYIINFGLMIQINEKTKFQRVIQRKRMKAKKQSQNKGRYIWEFFDAGKKWRPYDSLCNA